MKRILIIYAPFGSGHKSIASYIANYFEEISNDYEIKVLDVAKYANMLGKMSVKGFDFVINHRKNLLFSLIYDSTNNKVATLNQMAICKKAFDNPKIRSEIVGFNPDLTISTHFFGGNIIAYYNKLGLTNSKIMTVITDYVTHSFWARYHQTQDAFVVANEIVKNQMIKKGVPASKLYAYGLPFDITKIKNMEKKEKIIVRYNLDRRKPTYLFFSGGSNGSMANFEYLKALIEKKLDFNIIFVCGRNEKLEQKARQYVQTKKLDNVTILGFVKDVYSLLNISDVVITKPGGATVTECIDMKVPMILIPGNGGPEKYNARFISRKKYGTKVHNKWGLCRMVKKCVNNPQIVKEWHQNLHKEKKNEAIQKIFDLSTKLLK